MPLHVSSTRVHRQEVKIVLNSLWYHHTETSEWAKITKITKISIELYVSNFSYFSNFRKNTTHLFQCDNTRGCIIQF